MVNTLNIAHRGFSGQYPENTMLAFERAYEIGADGIELDVQLTKDGEVVIFHDYTIHRMTGENGSVQEMTLHKLQTLTIPDKQWIPTLDEYLSWVWDKNLFSLIELKSNGIESSGLEEKVVDLVRYWEVEDNVLLSSEYDNELVKIKELSPLIKCGLLVYPWNEAVMERAVKLSVECIHPDVNDMNEETFDFVRTQGFETKVWTVNDAEWLEWLVHLNVDAIITDFPDKLSTIQNEKQRVGV